MQICGFTKTTLLDYPKHLAATIFLGGCDFRCPFCHNASLVISLQAKPTFTEDEVLSTLKKRNTILEGVCITGGEPTLHKDLIPFLEQIKNLGLKVKLDTNGNNPFMLKALMDKNLLDYVAMDIKNSKEKYPITVGDSNVSIKNIEESVELIMLSGLEYEFRTTVVKEFHEINDFISIGTWITGAQNYFLQSFLDSGNTIKQGLSAYEKDDLVRIKNTISPYVSRVALRGIDL